MGARRPIFELIVVKEGSSEKRYPLAAGQHVVGRASTCDICVPESSLSRRHARLIVTDDRVDVEDLDSLNGSYLNGEPLKGRCRMTAADRLVMGDLLVRVSEGRGASPPQAWFKVANTRLKGQVLAVSGTAVLGRSRGVELQVRHATVSRSHARVTWRADTCRWVLEDLGSANGTWAHGVMVTEALLADRETVKLGDVEMTFHEQARPEAGRSYVLLALLFLLLAAAIGLLAADIFSTLLD